MAAGSTPTDWLLPADSALWTPAGLGNTVDDGSIDRWGARVSGVSSSILTAQNEPGMLSWLRALSVSHTRAQRLAELRTGLSVLIAVSGLVAAFTASVATPVTVLGAAWALAYSIGLASWESSEVRRAALLQEMFDTRLFGLPWNGVMAGEQSAAQEISWLSRRYKGREDTLRDYYEIPDLPNPYDVLACQLQNLGWGSRIRRRYARAVLTAVIVWAVAGLVVGGVAGLTLSELGLRWYVPSLAALLLGVNTYREQRDIAAERNRVLSLVRTQIALAAKRPEQSGADAELTTLARQVQDLIFQTRQRQTRVPNWFFHRFRETDRTDFQAAMGELIAVLGGRAPRMR